MTETCRSVNIFQSGGLIRILVFKYRISFVWPEYLEGLYEIDGTDGIELELVDDPKVY